MSISPKYKDGDRVRSLADHMNGMKGMTGTVAIVENGPYYAIKFDKPMAGMKQPHKWLAENEVEPEDTNTRSKNMSDKTVKVSNTADLRTAIEAGYTKDQIEIVQPDTTTAVSAARKEGHEEGILAGKTEAEAATKVAIAAAASAERTRITALAAIAEPGFEAEHKAAIEAGHSPETFALAQLKAAKDRGITIGAIRRDSKSAQHANASNDDAAKTTIKAGWDKAAAKLNAKK